MKYIKPNGTEIEINENSVEYAESLGWKPANEVAKEAEKAEESAEESEAYETPKPAKKPAKKKAPVKKAK